MDLLSVIRRWHRRDQLSIREIARRAGLSRNTIRKYLANGEVQPKYPARKSVSKLDPYAETLFDPPANLLLHVEDVLFFQDRSPLRTRSQIQGDIVLAWELLPNSG